MEYPCFPAHFLHFFVHMFLPQISRVYRILPSSSASLCMLPLYTYCRWPVIPLCLLVSNYMADPPFSAIECSVCSVNVLPLRNSARTVQVACSVCFLNQMWNNNY